MPPAYLQAGQVNLIDIDLLRGALANAVLEGMMVEDLFAVAEHAEDIAAFEAAVNILAQTVPEEQEQKP